MGTFVNNRNESLAFDAKTTEEYTEDAVVTDHAVEGDALFITDHRKDKPMTLEIEGVISESPFAGQAQDIGEADVGGRRGLAALKWFRDSRDSTLTWVGTRFGVVSDLLITSIQTSVPRSQSTQFRISLKQVKFASALVIDLPPEFVPKPGAEPLKKCSEQATDDVTPVANGEDGARSILQSINTSAGGKIGEFTTKTPEIINGIFGG